MKRNLLNPTKPVARRSARRSDRLSAARRPLGPKAARHPAILLTLFLTLSFVLGSKHLYAQDSPRATVGITNLALEGGPNTATVADTVLDTLETVLTMTGRFQPLRTGTPSPTDPSATDDGTAPAPPDSQTLQGITDDARVDNLITGSVQTDDEGRTIITLFAYNRQDDAVTVDVREEAQSLFSVFDAVDRAVITLLEGFTGEPVAFGALALSGDWQPDRDRVLLDGAPYDAGGGRITGLLARTYDLVVTRRSSTGEISEILNRSIEIEPDGVTAVAIPLSQVTTGSVEFVAGELPTNQILFVRDAATGDATSPAGATEGATGEETAGTPAGTPGALRFAGADDSRNAAAFAVSFPVVTADPPDPAQAPTRPPATLGHPLAGESLVIYNYPPWYNAVVDAFEAETGVTVQRAPAQDPEWRLDQALEGDQPPQVAFISQPGPAFDLLDLGLIDDTYRVFDRAYLRQFYRPDVLAFGHPDAYSYLAGDRSIGVVTTMSLKSLYWYAPSVFMMWGLSAPASSADLSRMVAQLQRAGEPTYSFAIQSDGATGWMITDWVEDRILQSEPLATYDAWSRGRLSFRDTVVESTITRLIEMFNRDGMMYGGIEGVRDRQFYETLDPLVSDPPTAGMAFGPSFLAQWHTEDLDRLSFFPTPPATPGGETRRLVGGNMFVVVEATPAARAFLRYLNRPETARLIADSLAGEGQIGNVVAHTAAEPDWYAEPQRSFAEIIASADVLRYDASDRMTREVGMERFLTGARSMVYGSDIIGILNSIDRIRRSSLR